MQLVRVFLQSRSFKVRTVKLVFNDFNSIKCYPTFLWNIFVIKYTAILISVSIGRYDYLLLHCKNIFYLLTLGPKSIKVRWDRQTRWDYLFTLQNTREAESTFPKGVSPPRSEGSGRSTAAHSAHGVSQVEVRVRYRTPTWYRVRNTPKDPPIACPPSTPINEQTLWLACADSMSV